MKVLGNCTGLKVPLQTSFLLININNDLYSDALKCTKKKYNAMQIKTGGAYFLNDPSQYYFQLVLMGKKTIVHIDKAKGDKTDPGD